MWVKVLSLFGGMECGRITLDKMGIIPTAYYSAEVDKFARAEVAANFPDVAQLGDVTQWPNWDIPWHEIDLVIGGSPCQGFSFAGKQLAFDDPRSALFFTFVDIVEFVKLMNPNVYFMLENVKMKKEHLAIIDQYMGVESVFINSALVCAQNRQRHYWCNWDVPQPEDRRILLADILESEGVGSIKNHGKFTIRNDKPMCIDANYHKGVDNHGKRTMVVTGGQIVGRKINPNTGRCDDYNPTIKTEQTLELRSDGKTNCLTTVQKDNVVGVRYDRKNGIGGQLDKAFSLNASDWRGLNRNQCQTAVLDGAAYRKLTVVECCRLQGVPDDYFKVSSNTQAYKMLGNGWQCDTIEHIFEHCPLFED
jgi:DNA-cytosine methyltransferase